MMNAITQTKETKEKATGESNTRAKPTLYALRVPTPVRDYLDNLRKDLNFPNISEMISFLLQVSIESKPWEGPGWVWLAPRAAMMSRGGLSTSQINVNVFNTNLSERINNLREAHYLSANSVLISLLFDVIDKKVKSGETDSSPLLDVSMKILKSQVHVSIDPGSLV